jgi:hypothetical protein
MVSILFPNSANYYILITTSKVNQPVAAPDPTQLLSLNCFVLGDDLLKVFTVEILKTDNVSLLRDVIKEKQSPRLNHVDASKLILSQVSLPVNGDLDKSLNNVDLAPLEPLLPLSQVFPLVEVNCLHVVVQAPTNGESISVFLHATDDLIDVVQRACIPRTQEEKRREIRSLRCIKVRVFFLLVQSLINTIQQGLKTSSCAS